MRRGLTVLVAAAGVMVPGTTSAEPAPGLDWRPCPANATVRCADLTVPVDWANPAAGTIDVAVARRPASEPSRRIGTLVYLPGGPGDSGVAELTDDTRWSPELRARFDLVSLDPRGTNASNPVLCDQNVLAGQPNIVPVAGGDLAEVTRYVKRVHDSCRSLTRPASLLDHLDAVSVATDVDALRAALGERRISVYGRSYGTLVGQMYAERFPRRVRALALDGVFDHNLSTQRFLTTTSRTAESSFTEFADWCAANTACPMHGRDVRTVYRDLFGKALRGELPVPPMALVQGTLQPLYGPDWVATANWLRSLAGPEPAKRVEPTPFPGAALCADHRVRISSQREWTALWHAQAEAAPTVGAHFSWSALTLCSAWPGKVGNPQHRTEIDREVPTVLLLSSRYDPATSYEWATNVRRQLDDSVLLTYDGWGHGVYERSACTMAVVHTYFLDGIAPRPGTHCAAVPV